MKNLLLILCLFSIPVLLLGQSGTISGDRQYQYIQHEEPPLPSHLSNPTAKMVGDTSWYWVSYWQIIDAMYNEGGNLSVFLWPDSNVLIEYSTSINSVWQHGYSDVLDPSSGYIDDEMADRIGFHTGSGYIIDSVFFYYLYKRMTADSLLDTLFLYTYDMTNITDEASTCTDNGNGDYNRSWVAYNRQKNRPQSVLTTDTILLDTGSVNSGNFYRLMGLPIQKIQLDKGEKMGLAWRYQPATAWAPGDTLYSYVLDTCIDNNSFSLGSYCEHYSATSGSLYPYSPVDDYPATNSGGIANSQALYGTDGWGAEYLNGMMWSCSAPHPYQHAMTWYHVATIGLDYSYTRAGLKVDAVEDYSNFNPDSWNWTFTDSGGVQFNYLGQSASHTFMAQGTYSVCVTASNSIGDSYTKCKNISVPPIGINDINNDMQISIWPNPVTSYVTIELNGAVSHDLNISIVDIVGTEIYSEDVTSTTTFTKSIDLSGYANGVYFVKIRNGNGISSHKLILSN